MNPFDILAQIATDPQPKLTARQIIEARIGRPIGPLASMPRDLRTALYLLAKQLTKRNAA